MIPKIVYQTWYQKKNIPTAYQKIINHNKKLNPEYRFILYDDWDLKRLFERAPATIRDAYFRINPHYGPARADLFRYYIIYLNGGIYLDIKIRCKKPFRQYIFNDDHCLLSYWELENFNKDYLQNRYGELQNWHLIYEPNHPVLKKMLDAIILKSNDMGNPMLTGKDAVLKVTGPILYTQILEPLIDTHIVRIFDASTVLDYGPSFSGIELDEYVHYTRLQEPLLLNRKTTIPNRMHHELKAGVEGCFVFRPYLILHDMMDIIHNCNVVFCKNQNELIFLAIDNHKLLDHIMEMIEIVSENQEKIFYYNELCIKQAKLDHNKIIFHRIPFLQITPSF